MANMLYNGVEIPDINTVWTDKESYPYACIVDADGLVALELTSTPLLASYNSNDVCDGDYLENGSLFAIYFQNENGGWTFFNSGTETNSRINSGLDGFNFVWASYDVYKYIGGSGATDTLVLAASDPVPVDGVQETAVVTETSGDGYALYNGVKLPNIDSVWTDKETYPYAVITVFDYSPYGIDALLTYLTLTSVPVVYGGNTDYGSPTFFVTADCVSSAWALGDEASFNALGISGGTPGVWNLDIDNESYTGSPPSTIAVGNAVWSSYDIESGDVGDSGFVSNNTTYLAASDPIPLDGMSVIEWNGVTTGLTAGTYVADVNDGITYNLYRVSDYTPIQAGDVLAVKFGSDYGGAVIENDDYFAEFGTDGNCYSYFIASASAGEYTANVGAHTATITLPTDGLYMYSGYGGEGQVTLYAYPNTSADLKPVYLRINGAWVKQTAYERRNGEWVRISTGDA